jgi:hypothetical protein
MQYIHITNIPWDVNSVAQKMNMLHTNNSWVLEWYGSIFLSTSHNAESATMWNVHHHEYVHVSWQWVRETLFILKWECSLLSILHALSTKDYSFLCGKVWESKTFFPHQIRTFPPYCLRSIPQYATRAESNVSRHQTNKLLDPVIISCAATDYAC